MNKPRNLASSICSFFVFAAVLSSFATSPLLAQDWARKMFSEFSHDFGTVAKNEVAEHRFKITNLYNEDIQIQSVRTSCACTDVSLTKNLLKSEESCELVAVFNTRNFVGPKQATVTVRFAAPYTGEVQLTVRGNIRGDVMLEPGMIDFGSMSTEVLTNKSATKRIQITKFNNSDWRIVDVKSTFQHIGVSLSNPVRYGNQIKYNMDVRVKDSAPAGFVAEELMIVAQERGQRMTIPIKFTGKVATALQISPEVLTFSAGTDGQTISKKVIVKGSKPFKINDVTCSNESFKVKADPTKSKKVHFVSISYSADQAPGKYEYDLEFVTDLNRGTNRSIKAVVQISESATPTTSGN